MIATTEPTAEEDALWASIGEMPACKLRRGVAADWYEDRAGKVECKKCVPLGTYGRIYTGMDGMKWIPCIACNCTGYIPDRNGRMAEALRATADMVPWQPESRKKGQRLWVNDYWLVGYKHIPDTSRLPAELFLRVQKNRALDTVAFPTAAAAILALCEAYIKVTYGEVGE